MSKTAIVTGGSRGLGKAMVKKLASMGYNVVVNFVSDRSREGTLELIEEIEKEYKIKGIAIQGDVSDYDTCKRLVDETVKTFGDKIDVLVNNAGIDNNKSFLKITPDEYIRLVNINLMSYLHMTHVVLPYMASNKEGNIINIASIGGMMGVAEQADYCAAKSGVIGFTRGLAVEFGPKNIRVNCIAPGMIWTDMLRHADQKAVAALKTAIPLGEIGEVEDIADCMEYLIDAKYVTGQTISPNGGILMP
ncbi:MAG: SDR family NAD(P)-dependent oxidoreductase [Clostridiaceae bacterium]|jgi:3-oxoacyl-[acyl-carrier protein] reductase|nr:SDR family NAD(P)-dependent oxidoreductase [Clostridiaceae bacterium]